MEGYLRIINPHQELSLALVPALVDYLGRIPYDEVTPCRLRMRSNNHPLEPTIFQIQQLSDMNKYSSRINSRITPEYSKHTKPSCCALPAIRSNIAC